MKWLLVFVLSISSVSFAGDVPKSTTKDPPKTDPNAASVPQPEMPKNCQKTMEADGSVLVTCDCEYCGHPEARDGLDPVPWSCVLGKQGITCGYGYGEDDSINMNNRQRI